MEDMKKSSSSNEEYPLFIGVSSTTGAEFLPSTVKPEVMGVPSSKEGTFIPRLAG